MSTASFGTKPVQFRLPPWARDFLDERSRQVGTTKTDVVIEALECLREKEMAALMAEGYQDLAEVNARMAEESISFAAETIPEWDE